MQAVCGNRNMRRGQQDSLTGSPVDVQYIQDSPVLCHGACYSHLNHMQAAPPYLVHIKQGHTLERLMSTVFFCRQMCNQALLMQTPLMYLAELEKLTKVQLQGPLRPVMWWTAVQGLWQHMWTQSCMPMWAQQAPLALPHAASL